MALILQRHPCRSQTYNYFRTYILTNVKNKGLPCDSQGAAYRIKCTDSVPQHLNWRDLQKHKRETKNADITIIAEHKID